MSTHIGFHASLIFCVLMLFFIAPANMKRRKHEEPRQDSKKYSNERKCTTQEANETLDKLNTIDEFYRHALSAFSPEAYKYYELGSMSQNTLHYNIEAFKNYRFRPRMLRNVSKRDMKTTFLGNEFSMPLGIAPSALHQLASKDGEIDTARAAERENALMILSSLSTISLEDVADAVPNAIRWHQIYIFTNRTVTLDMIHRAEKYNYKALVLTVDTPIFARSVESDYLTLPPGLKYGNLQKYLPEGTTNVFKYLTLDTSLTWDIVNWMKKVSKLPIVVKGVLTGEDARLAFQHGADAVYVSNHGGRQLDNGPATIEALPEVVKAVKHIKKPIYFDGGIRNGSDVIYAMSMGATGAFIGRANLYGLAACGDLGASKLVDRFRREIDLEMALSGLTSLRDIPKGFVVHKKYYEKIGPPEDI